MHSFVAIAPEIANFIPKLKNKLHSKNGNHHTGKKEMKWKNSTIYQFTTSLRAIQDELTKLRN